MAIRFKVTVVEDDHDLRYLYQIKLEREGFEVSTASDGAEGLKVVKEHKPNIVLLDLRMPVMDGSEMLEKMRATEWGAHPRVIILTNISRDEAPMRLRFLNVDRYIVKAHHTPQQVVDIIHEILGNRSPGLQAG